MLLAEATGVRLRIIGKVICQCRSRGDINRPDARPPAAPSPEDQVVPAVGVQVGSCDGHATTEGTFVGEVVVKCPAGFATQDADARPTTRPGPHNGIGIPIAINVPG